MTRAWIDAALTPFPGAFLIAAALCATIATAPLPAQQPATRADFVTFRSTDTVSIERFTRDAQSLAGEFVQLGLYVRYTARLRPDQSVQHFEFTAERAGTQESGRLEFTTTRIFGERSVGGVSSGVDVVTLTPALPFFVGSTVLLEQIARATLPATGPGANARVFRLFGVPATTDTILLHRSGHDSLVVLAFGSESRLALGNDGSVSGMSRLANRTRVERRASSSVSLAGLLSTCLNLENCRPAGGVSCTTTAWEPSFDGPTVISDMTDGLSGDGRAYIPGTDGVLKSGVSWNAGLVVTSPRKLTMNLDHPVPGGGGLPIGIVTNGIDQALPKYFGVLTQWRRAGNGSQNLHDIPVSETVTAAQMNVPLYINGRVHLLQMGPQPFGHCEAGTNLVNGAGTSSGTIHRASQTKWVVDLPAGSVGRLFDVHNTAAHAVDKGLYYVRLHYEIGQ